MVVLCVCDCPPSEFELGRNPFETRGGASRRRTVAAKEKEEFGPTLGQGRL